MEIHHEVQLAILKQLLFYPESRFSELNTEGLDNNHFNFHLKRLVELGLVEKTGQIYKLTPSGLEIAGRLDLKVMEFPRQPKVGVALYVEKGGKVLLGKRLKDPGKNTWNFYTRKVRFKESVYETARVCLLEETGLEAEFEYAGTFRIMNPRTDTLFVCFRTIKITGELVQQSFEEENKWYTLEEAQKLTNTFPQFKADLELYRKGGVFFKEIQEED